MRIIPLTRNQTTIVDEIDADLCDLRWYATIENHTTFYAGRTHRSPGHKKRYVAIHRSIMSRVMGRALLSSELVDHINGNTLDNRRSNLRLCTHAENSQNRTSRKGTRSHYKGVYFHKGSQKWRATLTHGSKVETIGFFSNQKNAALAYDWFSVRICGDFARLNIRDPHPNPPAPDRVHRRKNISPVMALYLSLIGSHND